MKDLMLMMAQIMPKETLIESIKEAVDEHTLAPTEENYGKLKMYCLFL